MLEDNASASRDVPDVRIRQIAPADKPRRLCDISGRYPEVSRTGAMLWRLKYRIGGRGKRPALGRYPACLTSSRPRRRPRRHTRLVSRLLAGDISREDRLRPG